MSRTRRVAVDTGEWSDPGFQGYAYNFQSFNASGYTVVTPPVPLRRADGGSETSLVVWQGGYVTFGTPSQAQIDFHQAYLAGEKRIFELPANTAGSSDFVATGMPITQVSSVCLQNSDYGYFIAWGDPIDASFSFDTERDYSEDCGELRLTSSGFSIDTGTDRTDYYDAYRFGTAVHDGAPPIVGTSGDNQLSGGNTPDLIQGGAGADMLSGGGGRDVFIYRGVQDSPAATGRIDSIDDFTSGVDKIDLRGLIVTGFQIVDLADSHLVVVDTPDGRIAIRSAAPVAVSDVLADRPLPESTGDKYFEGRAGNDRLVGGAGNDFLSGGDGNDTLEGGSGNDDLRGGFGTNILRGGDGDDYLESNGFGDLLDGGAGTDSVYLGFFDPIVFTLTSDFMFGSNRYVSIEQATFYGSRGNDTLTGGPGNDYFNGNNGSNTLNGADGNDTFRIESSSFSSAGLDIINGGNGTDVLSLSVRDFAINLSMSSTGDISLGNGRTVRMNSIEAIDFRSSSFGSPYNQTVTGGSGNDRFVANGQGNDTFRGGAGNDYFDSLSGNDLFDGGDGIDRVALDFSKLATGATYRLVNGSVSTGDGIKTLVSIESADITGSRFGDTLEGGSAADTINGGDGGDVLRGGLGDDTLSGDGGDDQLSGGGDNDLLIAGAGTDRLDGGAGIDTARLYVRDQATIFTLAEGVTVLTGQYGGDGAATLVSIERVDLIGSRFDDVLTGGGFDDVLRGGAGDDVLAGGAGSDTIIGDDGYDGGRVGYDRVVFNAAVDVDLTTGEARGPVGEVDRLSEIEWITAGAAGDRIAAGLGTLVAGASDVIKAGAANGTPATALSLDGRFGIQRDPFVADASLPHATVIATGAGAKDYYSFTVTAGARAIFDIDATSGFDSYIRLFDGAGMLLDEDDDDSANPGILDPGSGDGFDSFLGYTFATAGTYFLEVARYSSSGGQDPVPADGRYILNVSLADAQIAPGQILQGNLLEGGGGNDTLVSGFGGDWLYGGAGIDTASFERAVLPVFATLTGRYASGGGGQDRLIDFENLIGSRANDTLIGDAGTNLLVGGEGADRLSGEAGDDELQGGKGNDSLIGGAGLDALIGGQGDDLYFVSDSDDKVIELVNEGADRVFASVSYTLTAGSYIELLTTDFNAGTTAINLFGNELNNTIYGNAGSNALDGKDGTDILIGFGGDDFYFVDSASDQIIERASEGAADRVFASVSYTLGSGVDVELLTTDYNAGSGSINLSGNELTNAIYGNAGSNWLDGKAGADTLVGFNGDDFYFVDNAGDRVIESADGGNDRIFASMSYTLGAGSHVELLTTSFNAGTISINLSGNELANTIYGNAGSNLLDGKAGADTLVGLDGDDFYFIDNAGDRVIEGVNGGNDRIFAGVSYTLTAGVYVELLTTDYNAGTAAINLTGNQLVNTIYGNAGMNVLDGGAGADTMVGLGGNDAYFVDNAADNVIEAVNGGIDRVFADVSWVLSAGAEVETMSTTFHAGTQSIDLTGNERDNAIYGNAGSNILDGAGGYDYLIGQGGADTFRFSVVDGTYDVVGDFQRGVDRIGLSASVFRGLTSGTLSADAFNVGTRATEADDRILFDPLTGVLLYDQDGVGGMNAISFGRLDGVSFLSAADFFVI